VRGLTTSFNSSPLANQDTIAANSRDEQRKIIKYGHLVANILIFMNVHDQSKIMSELIQEGHMITKEQAACLALYRKAKVDLGRLKGWLKNKEQSARDLNILERTTKTRYDVRH
jgi:Tn3 transposase DDE domain